MRGFSFRNLKDMRSFAEAWGDISIVQKVAAQLPLFHNVMLLNNLNESDVREWDARTAIECHRDGGSLLRLHERSGRDNPLS